MSTNNDAPQYSLAHVARQAARMPEQHINLYTKEFVDALSHPANASAQRQWAMIEEEPQLLPWEWANVLLAGMAEFIAHRADLEPPAWTDKPERFLARPRFWGVRPQTRAHMLAETPGPFRRRNLFCGYVWLHSDRWRGMEDAHDE